MTLRGQLTICFEADWHCGTGTAEHGGIDRLINRDSAGLPFIPVSTLRGMWLDACETAANALDESFVEGQWHQLTKLVFGHLDATGQPLLASSPLVLSAARLTSDWQNLLTSDPVAADLLVEALTHNRMTTAIDELEGTAARGTLRTIEYARAGLSLAAPFAISTDDDTFEWAIDFLLGCGVKVMGSLVVGGRAHSLGHFGAGRRRGGGRCRATATGLTAMDEVVRDDAQRIAAFQCPDRLVEAPVVQLRKLPDPSPAGVLTHVADLEFTLKENLVAGASVIGNATESLDFIPGAGLLPLLRASMGANLSTLIHDDQIVLTDATAVISGQRATPVPRCLISEQKGERWKDSGVIDDERVFDPKRKPNSRPVKGWCAFTGRSVKVAKVSLINEAKNAINDQTQRPETMYTISSIQAGTVLRAQLWLPGGTAHGLKDGPVKLGSMRTKGFGAAEMRVMAPAETIEVDSTVFWDAGDRFIATFLLESDTHLVDEGGRAIPTADQLVKELRIVLGCDLELLPSMTTVAVARRESWTSQMLPRPSIISLAAGSVVTVKLGRELDEQGLPKPDLDEKRLKTLLAQGVGTRRAEGFGRLAVLPFTTWAATEATVQTVGHLPRNGQPAASAPAEWETYRRLAWEEELRRRIRRLAAISEERHKLIPARITASAVGTLRDAARSLTRDAKAVSTWLGSIKTHGEKSSQWGNATQVIQDLACPNGSVDWGQRLAKHLNKALADEDLKLPPDLGGNPPQNVASWLLIELARQAVRTKQLTQAAGARPAGADHE